MRRERGAVIFDLDDTLYPFRRFLLSGFRDLAAHLASAFGGDRVEAFRLLHRASRGPARGREIQTCLASLRLSIDLADELALRLRDHQPSLRLPAVSSRTLEALRARGWRLGILTNGDPTVQARKIDALGLAPRVDAVVFAAEHGSGRGKPDVEPFEHLCRQLDAPIAQSVMVGDSEECDVTGALAAGLAAIRCVAWTPSAPRQSRAAHVIDRLSHVPSLLRAVEERPRRHVA